MSFLVLENIEKTWPDGTRAVRGVELSVREGEFIVLLGPSGCGKTTTLRMVAGLEAPSRGIVRLAGENVTSLPPARRDVGFVFQFYALYPHLSVAQNIEFPLACAGVARDERQRAVAAIAERLGLTPLLARRPRELAGGDQQRVGLARALVRRPKVWLMDEPLGTLDADRRAEMCEFLRTKQLENGTTTLYVTHDQDEAMRLADRIVVMSAGEIVQVGTPGEVYDDPASLFVARFVGSPGMNLFEGVVRDGHFHGAIAAQPIALERAAPDGPCVLGFRPEFVRRDERGPLAGELALDAFAGSCRYQHVQSNAARFVLRVGGEQRGNPGENVRASIDPRGLRLFDPASGRRIA